MVEMKIHKVLKLSSERQRSYSVGHIAVPKSFRTRRSSLCEVADEYLDHPLWTACVGSTLTFWNLVVACAQHDLTEDSPKLLLVQKLGADLYSVILEGSTGSIVVDKKSKDWVLCSIRLWMQLLDSVTMVDFKDLRLDLRYVHVDEKGNMPFWSGLGTRRKREIGCIMTDIFFSK